MEQSQYSQLSDAANALDRQLVELKESSSRLQTSLDNDSKRAEELERSIADYEGERKNKVKDIERQIASGKKEETDSAKKLKKSQDAVEKLRLEVASLKEELGNSGSDLKEKSSALRDAEATEQQLAAQFLAANEKHNEAKAAYDREKERVTSNNTAINKLNKEKNQLEKLQRDAASAIKTLQHKIKNAQTEQKEKRTRVAVLIDTQSITLITSVINHADTLTCHVLY
jgi:chromosome segregation ATPase